jgi:signal transduction histidine kinase
MPLRLRPIRHWPLAIKLASAVFVLALIPQLVVALVNAEEVRSQLELREREGLQRRAVEAARRLEERVGRLRAYSELLATNPIILDAVEDRIRRPRRGSAAARHAASVERAQGWDARHEDVHQLLRSVRQANSWFQHAYLLDPSGLCISSSERETEPDMVGRVYDFRPYFRAPVADAEPYVSDILKNVHSPGTAIFVSAPVMRGGEVAAVVIIKIDTEALSDVVADLSARGGRILLVDRFGVVVSDAERGELRSVEDPSSLQFRPLASVDRYRTLFEDTRRYGDALHENYLDRVADPLQMEALWQRLRGAGSGADSFSFPAAGARVREPFMVGYSVVWAVPGEPYGYFVVAQSVERFLGPLEALVRTAMLRAVLVAGVVAVLLAFFIRRISLRVRRLAQATRVVAGGELGIRLNDPYGDELGELAASFDRMTRELAATIGSVEHARTEAEHARTEAERVRAAKHTFIAEVGRQFSAPIEQIGVAVTRLRKLAEARDEPAALEGVATLEAGVETLGRVVEKMRTLAGDDEVQTESVSIPDFLEEVARAVRPAAVLSSSKLSLDIDRELGEIVVDRAKLRQIVFQLLDNAFKFTRHGEVTVVALRELDDGVSTLLLRISDTGIGMTRGQIERFRAEDPSQADPSAGVGLVLAKLAAEAIGARLTARSEAGAGSTFTLALTIRET